MRARHHVEKKPNDLFAIGMAISGLVAIIGVYLISDLTGSLLRSYSISDDKKPTKSIGIRLEPSHKKYGNYFGPIPISPDMNPLHMAIDLSRGPSLKLEGTGQIYFDFVIVDSNDQEILKSQARLGGAGGDGIIGSKTLKKPTISMGENSTAHLGGFSVARADDYYVLMSTSKSTMPVLSLSESIHLDIRRNVIGVRWYFYVPGIILIFVGLLVYSHNHQDELLKDQI